jgi:hypothetical protein
VSRADTDPAAARPEARPSGAGGGVAELLLPVLILWNLFLFVIKDHVYPLFSPEVALSLFALAFLAGFISLLSLAKRRAYSAAAVAALLVFFIDFTSEPSMQLHKLALLGLFILLFIAILKLGHTFYLPAVGAMSVMLITTLVILMQQTQPGIAAFDTSGPVAKDAPPRLIHLLLDEHLGIEGFPKSHPFGRVMKERLKEFYKTRGFQLYGNAYGHYCNTFDAVPSLLNFTREPTPKQFVSGDEGSYVVTRNRYFELLKERGYRLHVISAGYLDFCAETPALTADCQQARFSSWGSVSALKVPTADKAVFLLRSFVTGYPRYQRLQRLYDISWRPLLLKNGGYFSRLADSMWMTPPAHTYTSNAMETIERTWNNILSLPQGHAAFIHLMLPHFPYSFGPNCAIRPLLEWEENLEHVPNEQRTPQLQAERYQHYFEQMDCVLALLDNLLDRLQQAGMLDDSIILVHGDHGSRLAIRDPTVEAMPLTESDLLDYFSLLYAVKIPGSPARYDATPTPVEDLLIHSLGLSVSVKGPTSTMPAQHFVFLRNVVGSREYLVVPYPVISP